MPKRPVRSALRVSEVLQRLLAHREKEDRDRRAESEITPIVRFAIALGQDPSIAEVTGDQLLALKAAISDIPTCRATSAPRKSRSYPSTRRITKSDSAFIVMARPMSASV